MQATARLRSEEQLGLLIAFLAHVAVLGALALQAMRSPVMIEAPERISVSLAEDVALEATAPELAQEAAAATAPILSDEPRPAPAPVEKPRELVRPTPTPTSKPVPKPRPTRAPAPPVQKGGGSQFAESFKEGQGAAPRDENAPVPASEIGAADRASLKQAIDRALRANWKPPSGVDVQDIKTYLDFDLNPDGTLAGHPRFVRQVGVNDTNRAQAERHRELAIRAVELARFNNLPPKYYNAWKRIRNWEFEVDTSAMKHCLVALAAFVAAPLMAQTVQPPASTAVQVETGSDEDEGLSGSTTYEGAWQDLGIAIPAFATPANATTPANLDGTEALGMELSRVITADLRNNGLFRPTGPDSLPHPAFAEITSPGWSQWNARGAEMLVHGFVRAERDGRLTVGCYLYDIALTEELVRAGWVVQPSDWRRAAHKCADLVYSRLSGESPFFDSKIAYIAETGPKDNRVKRLAIMDSDGANHRFITNGQSTALTPRYSPDYRSIVYLSYLNGNPRIYIYDIDTGQQRLVTQSSNPTFAPRWSPDGQWILYSMAIGGNTDIYRVSASGGESQRLTDSPGIDVGGSFSPDGTQIVFESDRSGTQQVYLMNVNGSNQRRITFFGGRSATPEWSPRGDQIAFTHITGDFRIAVMTPDGRNLRHLTNSWQDEAPTWAPNGRIIQFFRTTRNSGDTGLWQVDLTGENERRLPTPVGASDPAWGPVLP